MLLLCFENGHLAGKRDITVMPTSELEAILKIQKLLGRTWEIDLTDDPWGAEFPSFPPPPPLPRVKHTNLKGRA